MLYSKLTSILLLSFVLSACGGSDDSSPVDSDGDGVEDTLDAFPNDNSETNDSDGDGVGDNADVFPNDETETLDSDNDGVGDNADAFPNNAAETLDSDEDGVGDNADAFPNNAAETLDSDQDGYGDNSDAFPTNSLEWADTDGDTVGDNADAFPNDETEWFDTDEDGTGNNSDILPFNPNYQTTGQICTPTNNDINYDALLLVDCGTLSAYNLFADATNPTTGVNGGKSLKYDLSMPLFTDYATKYRFVVMPEDKTASYSEKEVFDMPVGTVLIKTFSMPADTSVRGFDNETLIETRLLVHRESGWIALPYRWNEEQSEATLVTGGPSFDTSVIHKGETLEFKYQIPSTTNCKECHQKLDTDDNGNAIANSGKFAPIGPKARFLNYSLTFGQEEKNQITKWQELNMLTDVPADLTAIDTISAFSDDDVDNLSTNVWSAEYINELARGYLDINCAHCHRSIGSANNYGMYLEYDRELSSAVGICKTPIAPPGDSEITTLPIRDIFPGAAEDSFLYERLSTAGPLKMPKIGRSLVHNEGAELIKTWINLLDDAPFNQSACE